MGHSAYRGGRDDREHERAEEADIEGPPFPAYFEDVQVQDCMDRVSVFWIVYIIETQHDC